jgi:hypothetical protein
MERISLFDKSMKTKILDASVGPLGHLQTLHEGWSRQELLGGPTTHHLIVFIKIYADFLKIKDETILGSFYSKQF